MNPTIIILCLLLALAAVWLVWYIFFAGQVDDHGLPDEGNWKAWRGE